MDGTARVPLTAALSGLQASSKGGATVKPPPKPVWTAPEPPPGRTDPWPDSTRRCRSCGHAFVFTGQEARRFARLNWYPPSHCPGCRDQRRQERTDDAARR
jgi:hypothetical protein